ncbi:sulfate adenylyltransferase subunit CysN [Geopsychrobacter electrodiphilus]|uniref:sulfate adenylyltransferase subunit CysN n=1 Tax=Geopsychrobacter electrodiphilus TaxID=225196 RepID=UPI000380E217|nr:sulfate adenylyltransferase subunit CysN [Geopsychrobacter electrodiphilus]
MTHQSELIAEDILGYLKQQEEKSLLRFITCGSVDDGKSTLIGRLLWDSKFIFEDQLAALEADSKRVGTQGEEIDFSLLLDGLQAEREQGITIDVAYRFFSTDKRKFIVADTPGHEQYTRNMVTGASSADVAVILVDARKGLLTQTRRHSYLVSLVGIRKVVLAINKMDLVAYDQQVFQDICRKYHEFAADLGFEEICCIPLSALKGENIISAGENTPWYQGPSLLHHLETLGLPDNSHNKPFRMRVQWVNRPNLDFRGFCGTIASGTIHPGDQIIVASSGKQSRVARIITIDGDLDVAVAGQAVTLTLEDEIDISRGEMLTASDSKSASSDRLKAKIVWMHDQHLLPGRSYLLKMGAATTPVQIAEIIHKVNVNSLQKEPGKALGLNEVGLCRLNLSNVISCDLYLETRMTGSFILIDRLTNATVGAGMVEEILSPSDRIPWQEIDVDSAALADIKGQKPAVIWITGRRRSGKTTLANMVQKHLHSAGRHSCLFDGDNLRRGLNSDLDDSDSGQVEHIRRIGEVAKLAAEAGLIVLVATTSRYAIERKRAREITGKIDFLEVYLDSPLETCIARYNGYDQSQPGTNQSMRNMSEISYEPPKSAELTLDGRLNPKALAEEVIQFLEGMNPSPEWII